MKIDRLVALILILLEHEVISARELAERLEVSRRTIYRDIDTLTYAGLPVFTQPGTTGGVGLVKSFKLDKSFLSHSDIQTLLTSVKSYRQLFGQKELKYVLEKLQALQRESGGEPAGEKHAIDLSLSQGNESLRKGLDRVETAMEERRYLVFDYVDRDGRVSSRKVEPYQVVFKESRWYVQGYCIDRADTRVFKLARMSGLQVSPDRFTPRDFIPLSMDGSDWMSRERAEVTIRIDRSVADHVIERFGKSHILEWGEETCLARYPIVPNTFGYDKLLALGEKCEVLGPPEVRAGFQAYVRRILQKYE